MEGSFSSVVGVDGVGGGGSGGGSSVVKTTVSHIARGVMYWVDVL